MEVKGRGSVVESNARLGSSLLVVPKAKHPPLIGIVKCAIGSAFVCQKEFDVEAKDNVLDTVP